MDTLSRIVITGAAGLVGQNLAVRLKARGYTNIVGIDKHPRNTEIFARLHPDITVVHADLAHSGAWEQAFQDGGTLVLAHAQIGGVQAELFEANNVVATRNVLAAASGGGIDHIVHISSSVVNSMADDLYTRSKAAQEALVAACSIPHVILRPTLMFGLFDRKHVGWLARFMQRAPVFPIPGDGRFRRQPLYAGDFCDVIISCIERRLSGDSYNISGQSVIDYIDLIRQVKQATGARTPIVCIPFPLFRVLLQIYALFDRDPPFTTQQLNALALPELFEVIDWPGIFGLTSTPLQEALNETFRNPDYANVVLDF
jgi:nucleoside-diphosphate-sugar epimerase